MTVEPPPDYREEVDIVRIDRLFLERKRNRYPSRGVAFLVILNGITALVLLSNFLRLHPQVGKRMTGRPGPRGLRSGKTERKLTGGDTETKARSVP